jgi:hypothetical protein
MTSAPMMLVVPKMGLMAALILGPRLEDQPIQLILPSSPTTSPTSPPLQPVPPATQQCRMDLGAFVVDKVQSY